MQDSLPFSFFAGEEEEAALDQLKERVE